MEPKLMRKDIKYQKKIIVIVSILVISLFIGSSFSLLSSSDATVEVVSFKTGDLNMEVSVTGTLSLEGELPKSYEDGFKSQDITLTLTNTGSLEIGKYEVKLEGDSSTTLEANYIRYSVSDDNGKTYLASKLLSDTNNIIYTGYSLKDSKTLKLKIWIDESAGANALKKIYNGKISVELYQNEDTIVNVVKSKLVSNYSGSNESFEGGVVAVNNEGNLYHEGKSEEIREYRYSGPTVNNYVTFNDEIWRIVGIFKEENTEHVKIVRNNPLIRDILPAEYKIGDTTYNIQYTSGNYAYWSKNIINSNDWTIAGLMHWLNTKQDETEGEANNGYLSILKGDTENMVEETKYYLGTVTFKSESGSWGIIDTPKEAYEYERLIKGCEGEVGPNTNNSGSLVEANESCRIWNGNKATWTGKIALLYPSDFGFSTKSSNWNSKMYYGSFDKGPSVTSWLHSTSNHNSPEWLLSPSSSNYFGVSVWDSSGNVNSNSVGGYGVVRPTLYLKNNVRITGGTGNKQIHLP